MVVRPYSRPIHGAENSYKDAIEVDIAQRVEDGETNNAGAYTSLILVAILGEVLVILLLLGRITRK